jgi:hypothetical protein
VLTDKNDSDDGSADLPELRAYIRSKKAALAGFMELGAGLQLVGDVLRVMPRSDIYVSYLNGRQVEIAALSSEFYGRPIVVELAPVVQPVQPPSRSSDIGRSGAGMEGRNEDGVRDGTNGNDDPNPVEAAPPEPAQEPAPPRAEPNRPERRRKEQRKSKLKAALWYAKRGLAVFPCHWIDDDKCSCRKPACEHPGKHPITKFGLNDATTNPKQIEKWWRRDPAANMAINCGMSGLAVIDIDPRHSGDDSWSSLVAGFKEALPDTVRVLTPSGGFHSWFRPPSGITIPSSNGRVGAGIDVKATGGYVLCPPDNHLLGEYQFEVGYAVHEIEIAEMPAELVAVVTANANGTGHGAGLDSAAVLAGVPEGSRDEAIFKLASKLRGAGVPQDFAIELILKAAANCSPPFPADTATEKVGRVYKKYPEGQGG